MKTLVILSLALLATATPLTSFAQNDKEPIEEQILEILEADEIGDEMKQSDEMSLTFYLDGQGKIVVLDVEAEDLASADLVKESLRGSDIEAPKDALLRTYRMEVSFNLLN